MNDFAFAKELGKMEATFEATIAKFQAQITALEEENANLLEAMTSFENKFGDVDSLKSAIEMIQKHISSMDKLEEEKEEEVQEGEDKEEEMTEETPEKSIAPAGEEAVVVAQEEEENYNAAQEEVSEEVTEEFAAEEEVTEESIEEQFAAEQKAEEVTEEAEDKTVTFNAITPEKVALINNFFNRK